MPLRGVPCERRKDFSAPCGAKFTDLVVRPRRTYDELIGLDTRAGQADLLRDFALLWAI